MKNANNFFKLPVVAAVGLIAAAVYAATPSSSDQDCKSSEYKVENSHLSVSVGSATLSNCKFGESKLVVTFDYSKTLNNKSTEIEMIRDISSTNPDVETYNFDQYEIAQINTALISHIEKQS